MLVANIDTAFTGLSCERKKRRKEEGRKSTKQLLCRFASFISGITFFSLYFLLVCLS